MSVFVARSHHPGGLSGWVMTLALASTGALADSGFEESFLRRDKNGATEDVFVWQNAITPGVKMVEVMVNDRLAARTDIQFVGDGGKQAVPCLSRARLKSLGIRVQLYGGWVSNAETDSQEEAGKGSQTFFQLPCESLEQRIPASRLQFDDTQQVLRITVPQEAVDTLRFTMISPQEWDHGVPALRAAYNGYYYTSQFRGHGGAGDSDSRSAYISLSTVGSLGAWRLYSLDSLYLNPGGGWDNTHDSSYLATDIAALRSNLQAGDIYTKSSGYMTGALPLTGVLLSTSEQMSLDNQFSYAPVIRGVARTNARLVVRQQGNVIYSTLLTPGAFAIDDLNSAQVGADLQVTVEESDGLRQQFSVPYTVLPGMIRPGSVRYSAAAGKYRQQGAGASEPWVATGSLEYGLERLTLSSSLLVSEDYRSLSTGASWNTGRIGAFSAEVVHARHRGAEGRGDTDERYGQALRLLYARHFSLTGTSLQILGWQYRSRDYLDFPEFISRQTGYRFRDDDGRYFHRGDGQPMRRRNRVEMNLNQNLYGRGSLYLALSQDRYYGSGRRNTSVSLGAGTTIDRASVSLAWTRSHDYGLSDNQLALSVSMPLGNGDGSPRDYGFLSYGLTRDRDGRYSQSLGYSGNAWDNAVNYSANLQRSSQGEYSQSASLGYNGRLANVSTGVSHGSGYRQLSAGMSGGVLLYGGGVILSPWLGNTVAIVETPGASGIGVSGATNARTDYFGHAMVSHLTPYRYNEIQLDTTHSEGVELRESSRRVVPSDGAAVLLKFATRVGRRVMVEIRSPQAIPLGAMVYVDGEKEEAGIVGPKGLTYLSGLDARVAQRLKVVWGETPQTQCRFTLPAATEEQRKPESWHRKIRVSCHQDN